MKINEIQILESKKNAGINLEEISRLVDKFIVAGVGPRVVI